MCYTIPEWILWTFGIAIGLPALYYIGIFVVLGILAYRGIGQPRMLQETQKEEKCRGHVSQRND